MNEEIIETISPEDEEFLQEIGETPVVIVDSDEGESDDTREDVTGEYIRRIGELEEMLRAAEQERSRRERELQGLSLLGDAGLPAELLGTVILAEDMASVVELIRRTVQTMVESEVSKRCRTDAPVAGNTAPLTKEELIRMPVAELQRMRDYGFAMMKG